MPDPQPIHAGWHSVKSGGMAHFCDPHPTLPGLGVSRCGVVVTAMLVMASPDRRRCLRCARSVALNPSKP